MKIVFTVEDGISGLKRWDEFAERLTKLVEGGYSEITVDFQNVERVSSLALGTLMASHKNMSSAGRRLVVANLSDEMKKIVTETRLADVLNIV